MELFRLPGLLQSDGDLENNWKKFRQEFDIYMTASEKNQKSTEIQAALLLNMVGDYGRQVFNDFQMNDDDKTDVDKILAKFEKFCVPKKNVVVERLKFNRRCQQNGETFDQFLEAIQHLVISCEYGEDEDNILRDRILAGMSNSTLREKVVAGEDVSNVKMAITWCRAAEERKTTEGNVKDNGTYILAAYVRRMDYVMENFHSEQYENGYSVYGNLHEEFKRMDTKKFLGIWRRESCGSSNLDNCGSCEFHWSGFMTIVIALCEETAETLELLAAQVAHGYHSLTIDRFVDLKDGERIAVQIRRYGVIQKLTRNADDWNSQCTKLEMVDAEYGGSINSFNFIPQGLPPVFP